MKRHFLSFSYLGSHFRSSAKATQDADLTSVIGALETGLGKLKCIQRFSPLVISSRTDGGVHAYQNTAHVDLEWSAGTAGASSVLQNLNVFLLRKKVPLRVHSFYQVSQNFHARHCAKRRSYLYRIAVRKPPLKTNKSLEFVGPVSEWERCHIIYNPEFDFEILQEALKLFPGTHNFTSFTGKPTHQEGRSPIRHIDSFIIKPGRPLVDPLYDPVVDEYEFWDFFVKGNSFVYRQVRRMVTALIAAAQGNIRISDLRHALHNPCKENWMQFTLVPSCGLYLTEVEYQNLESERLQLNYIHRLHCQSPYSKLLHLIDQRKHFLAKSGVKLFSKNELSR